MVKKWTLGAIAIALGMMLFGMNVHAKDSSRPIIIPVHNRIKELNRAIESIRNQTYQNFEIIIVDEENNQLLVKGSIPGASNGVVIITR